MSHPPPLARGPLTLTPVSDGVFRVLSADGLPVGNLKRTGAVWKFKAVGYGAQDEVEPGGGPLTEAHNTVLTQPDAEELNARLAPHRPDAK